MNIDNSFIHNRAAFRSISLLERINRDHEYDFSIQYPVIRLILWLMSWVLLSIGRTFSRILGFAALQIASGRKKSPKRALARKYLYQESEL